MFSKGLGRIARRRLLRRPGSPCARGLARRCVLGWAVLGAAVALWSAAALGPVALARCRPGEPCHRPPGNTPLGKPLRLVHMRLPGGYFSIIAQAEQADKTWDYTGLRYQFEKAQGGVCEGRG
jgi:hypothetical protein